MFNTATVVSHKQHYDRLGMASALEAVHDTQKSKRTVMKCFSIDTLSSSALEVTPALYRSRKVETVLLDIVCGIVLAARGSLHVSGIIGFADLGTMDEEVRQVPAQCWIF